MKITKKILYPVLIVLGAIILFYVLFLAIVIFKDSREEHIHRKQKEEMKKVNRTIDSMSSRSIS